MAKTLASWYKQAGKYVFIGGPAVDLMPEFVHDVADQVGGQFTPAPLKRHNPDATFTSRGCINKCPFCAVPIIEGELKELATWDPAPIICDNNLLATSQKHFDKVIDSIKQFKQVDFNQGLDIRMLNTHHIERLQELRLPKIRIAFDNIKMASLVIKTIDKLLMAGFPKSRINCYVLINFDDNPNNALDRIELLKAKGIRAFPQRFQAIQGKEAFTKNSWIDPGWTQKELARFQRYWSRQKYFSRIPYDEFVG